MKYLKNLLLGALLVSGSTYADDSSNFDPWFYNVFAIDNVSYANGNGIQGYIGAGGNVGIQQTTVSTQLPTLPSGQSSAAAIYS
jgi:hypothetical protein